MRIINKFSEIACFHLPVIFPHTRGYQYVTGVKMTFGQYKRCGEVGYNLERMINRRFGVSEKEDKLPARLTEVLQDENDPKSKVPLDQMKKIYYSARGWDAQGLPKSALLKKLGIGAG